MLSLAVYATPVVAPHTFAFLGQVLYREVTRALGGGEGREPAWVATDLAVALLAQALFGALLWLFVGRPGWERALAVVVPVFPGIVALNYVYLVAVPAYFLIEPDTTPEVTTWTRECAVADVWIPPLRASARVPADDDDTPLWVLEVKPPLRYGLLAMPDCRVTPLPLTQTANAYATFVADGRALYATLAPGEPRQEWSVFDVASGARTPLRIDAGQTPILSTDGSAVAWLRAVPNAPVPAPQEAVVHEIERPGARVVSLAAVGGGGLDLVQVDTRAGELVVARRPRELVTVDFDGRVRARGPDTTGVDPRGETIRLVAGGWVAWDTYRENASYRVAWSLPGRRGAHRVPTSRAIGSLAVSPDGRFIALSVTSALNIGSTQDAVYVLSTADGHEVFRKYFPKYTRSTVAFLGANRFVYTDLGGVNVLRIP